MLVLKGFIESLTLNIFNFIQNFSKNGFPVPRRIEDTESISEKRTSRNHKLKEIY